MDNASTRYRQAMMVAVSLQLPVTALLLMTLDAYQLFQLWLVALVGFWSGVGLVISRRPDDPTAFDLSLIRWGTVPLAILAALLTMLIWSALGLDWR